MSIGQSKTGKMSSFQMNPNTIFLGLMGITGVGGGQEFNERYVRKEVKHGGGSVMVWGCITASSMGHIVCIEGNMDGPLYTQILNDDILGTLKDLGINKKDVYFQQDSDLKHTSKIAQNWFKKAKLDVLDWAPSSPDMNIIERVWKNIWTGGCRPEALSHAIVMRCGQPCRRSGGRLRTTLLRTFSRVCQPGCKHC
jgi:hypothetical protein